MAAPGGIGAQNAAGIHRMRPRLWQRIVVEAGRIASDWPLTLRTSTMVLTVYQPDVQEPELLRLSTAHQRLRWSGKKPYPSDFTKPDMATRPSTIAVTVA